MKKHAAPIIVAMLLLLPVLYVGSYLALVVPSGFAPTKYDSFAPLRHYRVEHRLVRRVFWPLEQVDRKLRPGAWDRYRVRGGVI